MYELFKRVTKLRGLSNLRSFSRGFTRLRRPCTPAHRWSYSHILCLSMPLTSNMAVAVS
jgi:hypothetical protein